MFLDSKNNQNNNKNLQEPVDGHDESDVFSGQSDRRQNDEHCDEASFRYARRANRSRRRCDAATGNKRVRVRVVALRMRYSVITN